MAKKEKTSSPEKKPSKKQSRKGLIPWIGLTVFACAWMFVLGILVGREMVPVQFDIEKLQNELAALKEAVLKKEKDLYNIDTNPDNNKTQMKFYETLKKTDSEDNVALIKTGAGDKIKKEAAIHQKKPLPEKTVSSEKTKAPAKKNVLVQKENPKAPAKNSVSTQKEKPPDKKMLSQDEKKYTVQVASTRDPKDADRLVDRLKKEGYPAYRSIGKVPGKGIWYRVRVGYFQTRTDADSTLNQLKKGKINAIVVER